LETPLPHRPAHVVARSSGSQQTPWASQTWRSLAQQVVPQAFPLAQQTPRLPPSAQVVPRQQSVALSQRPFSPTHSASQTPSTQTPEQQAASPPAAQSAPAASLHAPSQQSWLVPHRPQLPPQPSPPQVLPVQSGVQPQTLGVPPPQVAGAAQAAHASPFVPQRLSL
jgi:hypothetical protein